MAYLIFLCFITGQTFLIGPRTTEIFLWQRFCFGNNEIHSTSIADWTENSLDVSDESDCEIINMHFQHNKSFNSPDFSFLFMALFLGRQPFGFWLNFDYIQICLLKKHVPRVWELGRSFSPIQIIKFLCAIFSRFLSGCRWS